ncbi:MAG: 2-C-methyl-D-erythritol 2,4-cyclodiphosphate synthase [Thermotogae bacterium]|nr:2-C-methyl-D-erythritol 2,4-cyclodiphosphate synthase [Thermotogota bacterium]
MVSGVILAAGRGRRAGGFKQFLPIGGIPLFYLSVEIFKRVGVEDVVVVLPPGEKVSLDVKTVPGGAERMDSVFEGVKAAKGEFVLVHDSARANLSLSLLRRLISTDGDLVIPAVRPPDSVMYDGRYIDRDRVLLVQTPQKVRRSLLLKAYRKAKEKDLIYTDEGSLLMGEMGVNPIIVEGERWNFKVTYREDIEILRRLKLDRHVAFGYDVHRLVEGRPLYLAGVKISDEFGALGHSDGDAVLHAVCDAILGFIDEGDIGTVFPDTDPRWKDADSSRFVEITLKEAEKRGVEVSALDITIVLERPKLRSFKRQMRENLSRLFGLPPERIAIKAKSGNGLYPGSVRVFALVELSVAKLNFHLKIPS